MKIKVKVSPGAKIESVLVEQDLLLQEEIYLVKVRARPVKGEANKAVVESLAQYFWVPKRCVVLLHGWTSRYKLFEIQERLDINSENSRIVT